MAKVNRKISNKAVANQKKQVPFYKNKILWIIICAVIIVGLAVGIPLGVHFNKKAEETEDIVDYFDTVEEVSFKKASYAGLKNYITLDYTNPQNKTGLHKQHIFIFAYNPSNFYPDSEDENYNSSHKDLLNRLIDLQKAINAKKTEEGESLELYLVDTSVGTNMNLLEDTIFGGKEDSTENFFFTYMENGELLKDSLNIRGTDYKIDKLVTTDINTMITTAIPQFMNYIADDFKNEE